jgi:hypothetical protein
MKNAAKCQKPVVLGSVDPVVMPAESEVVTASVAADLTKPDPKDVDKALAEMLRSAKPESQTK